MLISEIVHVLQLFPRNQDEIFSSFPILVAVFNNCPSTILRSQFGVVVYFVLYDTLFLSPYPCIASMYRLTTASTSFQMYIFPLNTKTLQSLFN